MAANTTIRNEKLFCLNCGGEYKLIYPIAVDLMTKKIASFNELHADCKAIWEEPKADQSQSIGQKLDWWISNGQVGASSKTMWCCFKGQTNFSISHPYDPDDFSRCYRLLESVPELKKELHRLKPLSQSWSNLVDNWDKLTEMFEQNEKEQWENASKIGMYQFMQKLIP